MTDLVTIGFRAETSGLSKAQKELNKTATAGASADKSMSSLAQSIGLVGAAIAALGTAALASDIIKYTDAWKSVNSQLRQVTESEAELLKVRSLVLQASKDTRSELLATTQLYAALDRSTTSLGLNTERQIELTKTINNLFVAGGKSAEEASGAIRQLVQGLEAGALRGDEFNSVAEGAPRILDALAESTGMARGELREFAATGGITAEVLVKALEDYSDSAQKMANQTDITFGQSMEIATINVTAFVGEMDGLNSIVDGIGSGIVGLSEELDSLINASAAFVGVLGTAYVASLTKSTAATITETVAKRASAVAELDKAKAVAAGTAAELAAIQAAAARVPGFYLNTAALSALAKAEATHTAALAGVTAAQAGAATTATALGAAWRFMLGPVGLIITALGAAAVAFDVSAEASDKDKKSKSELADELARLEKIYSAMNQQAFADEYIRLQKEANKLDRQRIDLVAKLATAESKSAESNQRNADSRNKATNSYAKEADKLRDQISKLDLQSEGLKTEILAMQKAFESGLPAVSEMSEAVDDGAKKWVFYGSAVDDSAQTLIDRLDPAGAALRKYNSELDVLLGLAADTGDFERFAGLIASLDEEYAEAAGKIKEVSEETSEWQKITERAADRIDQSFADVWLSIGDGFDGFTDSLVDGFKRMLAEMAHAAITRPILVQIGSALGFGGFSSLARAGGFGPAGGATGAAGGGLGFFNPLSFFGGNTVGAGFVDAGAWLAREAGIYTGQFGNTLFSGAGSYSNLAYGGAGLLGGLFGSTAGGAGGIGGSLGATIGLAAGGPIGAAIGAVLGGAVGSLFGGSWELNKRELNLGVEGGDFTGSVFTEEKRKKLWKNRYRRDTVDIEDDVFDDLFTDLKNSLIDAAEMLDIETVTVSSASHWADAISDLLLEFGIDDIPDRFTDALATIDKPVEQWLEEFKRSTTIDIKDLSETEIDALLQEWITETTDQMVEGIFGDFLSTMQRDGESAIDALDRVIGNMTAMTEISDNLSLNFALTGEAAAMAATNIVDLAGGLGNLTQLTGLYYNAFYDEQERFDQMASGLGDAFAELGLAIPETRDQFRDLIEGLDLSTESGQEMFAALMQLVPGLDAYLSYLEQQDLEAQAEDALAAAQAEEERNQAIREALAQLYDAVDMERDIANERLDAARDAYDQQLAVIREQRDQIESQYQALVNNLAQSEDALRNSFDAEARLIDEQLQLTLDARNAEIAAVQDAARQRIDLINSERQLLVDSSTSLLALSDRLTQEAGLQEGPSVSQALSLARTGDFTLAEQLQVEEIGPSGFASAADLAFAQAVQSNQVSELAGLAADRASQEQLIIDRMDAQIATIEASSDTQIEAINAQIEQDRIDAEEQKQALSEQLDALLGIDNTILSLSDAIDAYTAAQAKLDEFGYQAQIDALDEQIRQADEAYQLAIDVYNAEIERLDQILVDGQAQYNALLDIEVAVYTVQEAINNLTSLANEPPPDPVSSPYSPSSLSGQSATSQIVSDDETSAAIQSMARNIAALKQEMSRVRIEGQDVRVIS